MQGRDNEAGMFMSSWILEVLFKKHHRGIYFKKEFKSHSFKFYENKTVAIVYKDRIYKCSKCGIKARCYRNKHYSKIQDVLIDKCNKTCNQIIMERACK